MFAFLIALILVSGYVLVESDPIHKYQHKRLEGWNTYLHVAKHGIKVFIPVCLWVLLLVILIFLPATFFLGKDFWRFIEKYYLLIVDLFFVVTGLTTYYVSEKKSDENKQKEYPASLSVELSKDNAFESLITTANDRYKSLLFSLDSKKVYIGIPYEMNPVEGKFEFVQILPLLSGRRTAEQKLEITTNYDKMYNSEEFAKMTFKDYVQRFGVVIPVSEIVTIHPFEPELHKKYFQKQADQQNSPKDDD